MNDSNNNLFILLISVNNYDKPSKDTDFLLDDHYKSNKG